MTLSTVGGRTLVVGGYGYRNLGDEAMLAGLLTTLDRDRVTVLSRDPAETTRLHGVRSVGLAGAISALPGHETILIGGGGLFGRDMGAIGRLLPVAAEAAARIGRTVRLRGVGFDRDMPASTARLLERLLPLAAEVTVRDRESVEIARELGGRATAAPDLSELAPVAEPAAARTALARSRVDPSRPFVLLALTDVDAELGTRIVRALTLAAGARPDLAFAALPMSRHPSVASHDDRLLAARLQRQVPSVRVLDIDDPAVALSAVGQSAAVVGMRYHSLLFADRMGVPVIAVPYAEKCRHWLAEHGHTAVAPDAEAIGAALDRTLGSATTSDPARSGIDERELVVATSSGS